MRVVVLEGSDPEGDGRRFLRTGAAGLLRLGGADGFETDERVVLSPNSAHALLGHGVVERLDGLPLEGSLGSGAPAVVPPAVLEDARAILYDADRHTYGGTWEFAIGSEQHPEPVEYRLRIANREYQVTLVRLVDLMTRASRHGHAVWLQLEPEPSA